jgi:hypothetical protein
MREVSGMGEGSGDKKRPPPRKRGRSRGEDEPAERPPLRAHVEGEEGSGGTAGLTYGFEVPTLFQWIHPDDLRDRAAYLAELGREFAIPGAGEAGQGAREGAGAAEAAAEDAREKARREAGRRRAGRGGRR